MRILLVNYEYPPIGGGGGVISEEVANELSKKHEIDVLTSGFSRLTKVEKRGKVAINRVQTVGRKTPDTTPMISMFSFMVFGLLRGFFLMRRKRYDIVHSYFSLPSGVVGVLLSKLFGLPHALTIIGGDIYDPTKKFSPHRNWLLRRINRFVINNSAATAAISTDTRRNAVEYYGINKEIKVIPVGFKKPEFKRTTRAALGLSQDDFLLISVGRLIERKGFDNLIRALPDLDRKVKLLLVGDGPERKKLDETTAECGVSDRVVFLGPVYGERKLQYLGVSDLYVLSSIHEGFCVALLEAMECGLPIVATNNGGQVDFLKEGGNALLVEPADSMSLSNAIKSLIEDNDLMLALSGNNRDDVKKFYVEEIAGEYDEFLQHLLHDHGVEFKAQQRDYHDSIANDYDKRGLIFWGRENRNHYKKIEKIVSELGIKKGEIVLEVGSGTGIHAEYVSSITGATTICVDLSQQMLIKSMDRVGGGFFIVADGEKLPIVDESVDAVYYCATLHHTIKPKEFIAESLRVLKKQGRIGIVESNWLFPKNLIQGVLKKQERKMLDMRKSTLMRWFRELGVYARTENFIYTPPFPKFMFPVYDFLDKKLSKIPVLSEISICIFINARKPGVNVD